MKKVWYLAAIALVLAGACSSDDDSGDASETTEAPAQATDDTGDAGDEASASTTTEAGVGETCPEETSLEIVGGVGTEIDAVTGWSDEGPHPDNTVDYDGSLSLVFADYEIPIDEQFGYSIPIAGSEVPDGGTEFQVSLAYDGVIEPGLTFVDQTADAEVLAEHDGTINFISLHEGTERAVLGETVVTITEIDDDVVCGEIAGVSETELQTLTAVNGEFVVDRIQALEADAEADTE